jgi:multidrug efflux system membrane fusion protein
VSLRKIRTGAAADGHTAVLAGLAVGDRVVVDGADHLSDGAKIRLPKQGGDKAATKTAADTTARPQS